MTAVSQETWAEGATAPTRTYGPITRTQIVRYAGAGGDFNPIHHDEPFAQAAGYPSVFAHGMLTAGILSSFVADWVGRDRLRRYAVRYVGQVWPGDTLVVDGRVASRTDDARGADVDCALEVVAESPAGERRVVLRGTASARLETGADDDVQH